MLPLKSRDLASLALGKWSVHMRLTCRREASAQLTATQGLGIALVAAQRAQVPITLIDTSEKSLEKGLAFAGMQHCFYFEPIADPA